MHLSAVVLVCALPFYLSLLREKEERGVENKKYHADLSVASRLLLCVHMGPCMQMALQVPTGSTAHGKKRSSTSLWGAQKNPSPVL